MTRRHAITLLQILCIAAFLWGCGNAHRELAAIPTTDVSALEPAVRAAIASAQAAFDRVVSGKPSDAELANAYGELAMVYHAQDLATPAEVGYANAHKLAPADKRWPYLLGHLYADASRLPEAISAFEAVRAIDGNDAPTEIYLGQLYLLTGDAEKAKPMFEKARSSKDAEAAALTGLGKVALLQGRYQDAVENFERALKLRPDATRLRQPLAMAYRRLGDSAKADANLARYAVAGGEPGVTDPIVDSLSSKVVVSRVLLRRGQRFGKEGRFDLAEEAFRAAVASDPNNAEAVANLGISLANLGRTEEAQRRLAESLRMDDTNALAHFSLGVVLDRQGRDEAAINEYRAALARDPNNVQARAYLADAKMRTGLPLEAVQLYREALAASPGSTRMQWSLAMALVKGRRYGEARRVLEAALKEHPEDPALGNALARILATAPEAAARDGKRALELAKTLFEATRNPDVGQTYAMALAETGNFEEAIKLQRETIIAVERSGAAIPKSFLERNLALYQLRRPTREGWPGDDPSFQPRSPAVARVTASSPTS
jgi:tetratricopeptide (TPR) repeat protein